MTSKENFPGHENATTVIGHVEQDGVVTDVTLKYLTDNICNSHQSIQACRQLLIPGVYLLTDLEYISRRVLIKTSELSATISKMKAKTNEQKRMKRERNLALEDFQTITRHLLDLILMHKFLEGDIKSLDPDVVNRVSMFSVCADTDTTNSVKEYLDKVVKKIDETSTLE